MSSEVLARHFKQFVPDLPTAARRGAALLAAVALVACDSTRPLGPTAAPTVSSEAAAAFGATGTGTSAPSVIAVSLNNASFEGGYTGWAFPGGPGSFVDIGNLWQASDGTGSVDLNGFSAGFVRQTFVTIPGVQYTVRFDLAGNPGSPQGVKKVEVSAGSNSATYAFNTVGRSGTDMGWTPQTFVFTATAVTSTLTFQSTYLGGPFPDNAQGPALDNVRITWTPKPTTTTVTFGSGPFVYNGSAFTATASVDQGGGTPVITYSGDCTNAGATCTATATTPANGQFAASTATADITIEKAPTTTTVSFGSGPFVYNGSAFTASASVSPAAAGGSATITYTGDCTNAGSSCAATASFAGNDNYAASSSESASITIDKAPTTTSVSFGGGPTVYYTGTAFTASASVSPAAAGSATIAYSGQCTLAGVCSATATYAGNGNYLPSSASASVTIKYPVVTTGDRCKSGGWRFLTDDLGNLFKNQGDCVSYVATKGKNKGAGGA
jgi:choice-of-anchor C domain-containing protein